MTNETKVEFVEIPLSLEARIRKQKRQETWKRAHPGEKLPAYLVGPFEGGMWVHLNPLGS